MSEDLKSTCKHNLLLKSIRDSGLNFVCQETPWSFYLTLRKSFLKTRIIKTLVASVQNENLSTENEQRQLEIKLHNIEAGHAAVTKANEEEIHDSRELKQQLGEAQNTMKNLSNNF
jgi:hypothetical protein